MGSPKLRIQFPNFENKIITLFEKIDELFTSKNIELTIEPNAKIYGGDYFHDITQIVKFINKGKFNKIKTMIDTHNFKLQKMDSLSSLENYIHYINRIL